MQQEDPDKKALLGCAVAGGGMGGGMVLTMLFVYIINYK